MSMTTTEPRNPALRLSDPRLPLTVSRAAIEIDRASHGERVEFDNFRRFTAFLHQSLHEDDVEPCGTQAVWLDANTVDVMGNALTAFEGAGQVRTVKDVLDHALKLLREMETVKDEGKGDFARLRSFCVAFGNSLLSHRASVRHEGPVNPHRR